MGRGVSRIPAGSVFALARQSRLAALCGDKLSCLTPFCARHSLADISKAQRLLGYAPTHRLGEGLAEAMDWYVGDLVGE